VIVSLSQTMFHFLAPLPPPASKTIALTA